MGKVDLKRVGWALIAYGIVVALEFGVLIDIVNKFFVIKVAFILAAVIPIITGIIFINLNKKKDEI